MDKNKEILNNIIECYRELLRAQTFVVDQHIAGVTTYDEFHRLNEMLVESMKHLIHIKILYTKG